MQARRHEEREGRIGAFRPLLLTLHMILLSLSVSCCAQQASTPARATPARAVILVVASRLMPRDLRESAPRPLQELIRRGCTAVVSNRGASFQGPAGGYGSIGAGAGVGVPRQPLPAASGDWRAFAAAMQAATRAAHTGGTVGALGQAVRDAGGITALVGSAHNGADGTASRLVVMDARGGVTYDRSDGDAAPRTTGPPPDELASSVRSLLDKSAGRPALLLLDPGDTERADAMAWWEHPPTGAAAAGQPTMRDSLSRLSDLLVRLHPLAEQRRCLLVLVSPMPRARSRDGAPGAGLTPLVVWGLPYPPGPLTSASTRRPGLVLGLDLAPTLLDFLEIPRPRTMTGNPVRRAATDLPPSAVWAMEERVRDDYGYQLVALPLYGLLAALIALIPVVFKRRPPSGPRERTARFLILAGCAGPAALILPLATPAPGAWGPGLLAVLLSLLLPLGALRLRGPLAGLTLACAVPALVLLLDGLTRGQLFRDALWGRMPIAAGRLYGIDNTCLGVLLGGGWVALGRLADAHGRLGRVLACVLGLVTALVVALPPFGANVGGGITSAAALGFLVVFLFSRRAAWNVRSVVLGTLLSVGLAFALLALSIALDTNQRLAPSSHLAAGMQTVGAGGLPAAWDIALRKLWQNLAISVWLVVPAVALIYPVLRTIRRDREWIARRLGGRPGLDSALRSLLPAMAAGYLFNDSGAVTDLFLAIYYLGALLYLWLGAPAEAGAECAGEVPQYAVASDAVPAADPRPVGG